MNLYFLSLSFSILWIVSSEETNFSHSSHGHHHHHDHDHAHHHHDHDHAHHHHDHDHDHDHDHRHLGAKHKCGTPSPPLDEKYKANAIVKSWVKQHGSGGPKSTVTISTYFHVVHDGTEGMLTSAEITSQLNKLNSDFSGTGFQFTQAAITETVNSAWHDSGAETTAYYAMKEALRQGDATDLNVYFNGIGDAAGDLIGYATFPTAYLCYPLDDGVVVDYRTVPGGTGAPYDLGATLTHEVGHWLGLYHVFEGGCADLDEVSDTPAQEGPTWGCPSIAPDSCPGGGLDSIHNHMDYSDDVCVTDFTPGQITRMTALWSERQNPQTCVTEEPTQEPTPAPTDSPTDNTVNPVDDPPCFSPNVSTNVLGKGTVMMKDIAVGDKVLTESGEYKTVFTISHFHPSRTTTFIQLHSQALDDGQNNIEHQNGQPIELTPRHMLFLHGVSMPVPASDVKVGDELRSMKGPQRVTKVTTIIRNGIYNPITTDGTIVVGGKNIIASTYTSYTGTSHIEIGEYKLVSFHTIADLAYGPYRSFCMAVSLDLCNKHTELSGTNQVMKLIYNQWSAQKKFEKFVILFIYLIFFCVLNIMLTFNFGLLLLVGLFSFSSYISKTKQGYGSSTMTCIHNYSNQ